MTRRELSDKYGVSIATLINWSNGFYFRGKKKIFYVPTKAHLEFTRTELGQPLYTMKAVKDWFKLLKLSGKQICFAKLSDQ